MITLAAASSFSSVLSGTGVAIVYWIINSVMQFFLSFVFSLILTLLEWFSKFLLQPFNFTSDMFVAVFGVEVTEGIEEISIAAGLAISVLLLVFGLIRVFSGRFTDDVPNPFALVGRFLIAVVADYWIITIIYDYIFPLAQKFFDKALTIGNASAMATDKLKDAVTNISTLGDNGAFKDASAIVDQALTGLSSSLGIIIILTIFAIGIIAFIINVFKLVVENAERYFTINLLTIAAPLATSTIVSEKSSGIFKSWWQMMLSNILTIIFNILGFRMLIFAFNNCMTAWITQTFDIPVALTSIIALVAASKMINKFDQLLSLLTFKINPIQNRSLILSTLSGFAGFQKGIDGVGKMAKGVGEMPGKFANSTLNPLRMFHKDPNTGKVSVDSVGDTLKNDAQQMANKFGFTNTGKTGPIDTSEVPTNNKKLDNLPYDFNNHMDSLKNSNNAVRLDQMKLGDTDITSQEGFDSLKHAVEDKDNAIYGITKDPDGNFSLTVGPRGGEGGIAPDTLKNAMNGCEYYFDATNDENPLDSLPSDRYIAGAEVLSYRADNPDVPMNVRYYMTKDPEYASPYYHERGTILNGNPIEKEDK